MIIFPCESLAINRQGVFNDGSMVQHNLMECVYDIQGRRLSNPPQKGIYTHNGENYYTIIRHQGTGW